MLSTTEREQRLQAECVLDADGRYIAVYKGRVIHRPVLCCACRDTGIELVGLNDSERIDCRYCDFDADAPDEADADTKVVDGNLPDSHIDMSIQVTLDMRIEAECVTFEELRQFVAANEYKVRTHLRNAIGLSHSTAEPRLYVNENVEASVTDILSVAAWGSVDIIGGEQKTNNKK